MRKYFIISIIFAVSTVLNLNAQKRHPKFESYIEKYHKIAIAEQKKHKIPASITLAQGLLESAAGESRLASQGKNHFGIKCGGDWYGKTIKVDDDAIGECFRFYNDVAESFKDHSIFLKRQRYAFLFDYEITDYKAWAHGLKRAGYATDPNYPNKLITIIETYELHKYDTMDAKSSKYKKDGEDEQLANEQLEQQKELFGYIVIQNNGVKCVNLVKDDNLKNISREFGFSIKQLMYFNDMYKDLPLSSGDYVYLWFKKGKAEKGIEKHKVQAGESMHSIAQDYGIKMKKLYKLNKLEYGSPVKAGQIIKLR